MVLCSTRSPPHRTSATTWSPPTAASSPSATPASPDRWAATTSTPQCSQSCPTATDPAHWLVASVGGIFAFDATFRGSMGGQPLNKPIRGMVRYGNGYLMVASDGGIFSFSDKP